MSLLRMSLSGAILIMVVVIIRAITINKLPKMTFLIFWGIAIVRLLLPISLPSASSVFTLTNKSVPVLDSVVLDTVEKGISDFTSEFLTNQQTTVEDWTTQVLLDDTPKVSALFLVWIIGASLFAGYFLVSYLRCRHEFKTSLPVQNNFVKEWLSDHPLRRTMEVRSLTGISTPLTYGLIHPVILIPKKTNWENERQIQYMLFHEYVHICRFDSIGKLIVAATICIHWFNPMVWVLYILFNRDIELACDERVVRHFGETDRAAYARTLIDMEEQRQSFAPFYNCFAKNAIEERIEAIMKFKKKSIYALSVAFILVLIGTIAAFATSASSSQEQSDPSIVNDTDISLGTAWTGGVSFAELAPGEEIARSEKIVISPNENFRYAVTYNRASLILEIGLRSPDGTEYSRTITGGSDDATIENVPAGTYELFVRNSGDYSEFPTYKDGSVSYSATGCVNFLLEVSGIEINVDDHTNLINNVTLQDNYAKEYSSPNAMTMSFDNPSTADGDETDHNYVTENGPEGSYADEDSDTVFSDSPTRGNGRIDHYIFYDSVVEDKPETSYADEDSNTILSDSPTRGNGKIDHYIFYDEQEDSPVNEDFDTIIVN